jgi:uncharacterized protein YutD
MDFTNAQSKMKGFWHHGNEHLIKYDYIYQLRDYKLLKKYSTPWI